MSVNEWMDALNYPTLKSGLICTTALEVGLKQA